LHFTQEDLGDFADFGLENIVQDQPATVESPSILPNDIASIKKSIKKWRAEEVVGLLNAALKIRKDGTWYKDEAKSAMQMLMTWAMEWGSFETAQDVIDKIKIQSQQWLDLTVSYSDLFNGIQNNMSQR
jgi:hypothetical protein